MMMNVCMIECGGVEGGEQTITIFGDTHTSYICLLGAVNSLPIILTNSPSDCWWGNFTLASYGMLGSQFVLRWMLSWSVEAIHYLVMVTSRVMFLQLQPILEAV